MHCNFVVFGLISEVYRYLLQLTEKDVTFKRLKLLAVRQEIPVK